MAPSFGGGNRTSTKGHRAKDAIMSSSFLLKGLLFGALALAPAVVLAAGDTSGSLGDKTNQAASDTKNAAGNAADKTGDSASKAATETKDTAGKAYDKTKDETGAAYDKA